MDNARVAKYMLETEHSNIDVSELLFEAWKEKKEMYNTYSTAYDALQHKKKKNSLTEDDEKLFAWLYLRMQFMMSEVEYIWSIAFELDEASGYAFQEKVYTYQRNCGI